MVKNPPAKAGDVRDLGSIPRYEDPLEEGMATHYSILAWRIRHGQRSLVSRRPLGGKQSDTTEQLSAHTTGFLTNLLGMGF